MKFHWSLLSSCLIAGSINAVVFTNSVSTDSFVRAAAPASNYGGAGALSVSGPGSVNGGGITNGVFDSFIRFNTGDMVANFNSIYGAGNWAINGVKLRLTELGAPSNGLFNRGKGAFEIRWIANDNWTEGAGTPNAPTAAGITFNDEMALLNSATDVSLGGFTNVAADATLSFPLGLAAAFLSDLKSGGEVGLYLTALDSGIGFTVDSRTFTTVSARPFLEVSAVAKPVIIGITGSAANVALEAANGVAGGTYFMLASPNVALPLNQWTRLATTVLTADGAFTMTVTNGVTGNARQFFIIERE